MDRELTQIGPPLERCLASSFAKRATPGAPLACEADIEDAAGSKVWLRRTSREADFERVAARNVALSRAGCAGKMGWGGGVLELPLLRIAPAQ